MKKLIILTAAILSLTGCSTKWNSFAHEAGAVVDDGEFGNATHQNAMVMRGEGDFAMDLALRFKNEVPSTVNFAFDSAVLDASAQAILRQQADWIRQFPEVRFRVFGYTDNVGGQPYNKRLGKRRANAVVAYLGSQGINRSRLEALVSYGKTRPLVHTPGPERQNRRSVTEVSGFVKRHPTVLDGKYGQVIYREYVASAVPVSGLVGAEVIGASGTQ